MEQKKKKKATGFCCTVCDTPATTVCSRCKSIHYCGTEHQTSHWHSTHKLQCLKVDLQFMSQGLVYLGFPTLYVCLDAILKQEGKALPIVEMGSGNGYVLKRLQARYRQVVGIDNLEYEFISSVQACQGAAPQFATMKDYLRTVSPSKGDHSILLLNWPSPNLSEYDYDSFVQMKPAWCVVVLDTSGGSGGTKFLSLLRAMGLELDQYLLSSNLPVVTPLPADIKEYRVLHTTKRYGRHWAGKLCFQAVVLSRVCQGPLTVRAPRLIPGVFSQAAEWDPASLKRMAAQHGYSVEAMKQLMTDLDGAASLEEAVAIIRQRQGRPPSAGDESVK